MKHNNQQLHTLYTNNNQPNQIHCGVRRITPLFLVNLMGQFSSQCVTKHFSSKVWLII